MRSRSPGSRYSARVIVSRWYRRGDGISMAVAKWQVIAGHVKRRVIKWKCETSALETLKVVQCRPFQNSTSRLRPALPFPHRSFWRQPSKSGEHTILFMGEAIAAGK